MFALRIETGKQHGKRLTLPGEAQLVIGRDDDCRVRLMVTGVSRKHCRLRTAPNGLFITDLNSRNGTLVNGVPITHEVQLTAGDHLAVGDFSFTVVESRRRAPKVDRSDVDDDSILEWLADDGAIKSPGTEDTAVLARSSATAPAELKAKTVDEPSSTKPSAYRYLNVRQEFHVTFVRLNGKRFSASDFEPVALELLLLGERPEHERIVLNLSDVQYLPSVALVRLTTFEKKVRTAGRKLALCCLQPVLQELFQATQLDKLFHVYENEREAMDSFWK